MPKTTVGGYNIVLATVVDVMVEEEDYKKDKEGKIPLLIDEDTAMVMEMKSYFLCENARRPEIREHLPEFNKKFDKFKPEELDSVLHVTQAEVFAIINNLVSCIGCRRGAENLVEQVYKYDFNGFLPFIMSTDCRDFRIIKEKQNPLFLSGLFYFPSPRMKRILDSFGKNKSGRRCPVHSLEAQRIRTVTPLLDVWDDMALVCQEVVALLVPDQLFETVSKYLKKNKFCEQCQVKVMKAFHLLCEEVEVDDTDEGYCESLYNGVKYCREDNLIHVDAESENMSALISRAIPELLGNHRERHAKSMDIAQEEVLICIGLSIFEKLHRILVRFREEVRNYDVIMYATAQAFRRKFELALEQKLGMSQLELLCDEISKETKAKDKKKLVKKVRRRRKKDRKAEEGAEAVVDEDAQQESDCEILQFTKQNEVESTSAAAGSGMDQVNSSKDDVGHSRILAQTSPDPGYFSTGTVEVVSCSSPEVSEGISIEMEQPGSPPPSRFPLPYQTLEEQLDSTDADSDDFESIPEEEIRTFLTPARLEQRNLIRQTLRLRFENYVAHYKTAVREKPSEASKQCLDKKLGIRPITPGEGNLGEIRTRHPGEVSLVLGENFFGQGEYTHVHARMLERLRMIRERELAASIESSGSTVNSADECMEENDNCDITLKTQNKPNKVTQGSSRIPARKKKENNPRTTSSGKVSRRYKGKNRVVQCNFGLFF